MKSLNQKITDWKSKRVWIIGASSGIGAALATELTKKGAILALSARTSDRLRLIASGDDLVLPLNVVDSRSIVQANKRIYDEWGSLDLVVYCAGYYEPMRAWDMYLPAIELTLDTNLKGVFNMLHAVVPTLTDQGNGGICMVASVAGYTGLPKALAYGPSKAALINLTQALYSDLKPKGVDVYLVNPGFVKTRLTRKNDFTMPAIISPEEAAKSIIKGLAKGTFEIHFPKKFTSSMRLLALLPDRLRFYLLKRAVTE